MSNVKFINDIFIFITMPYKFDKIDSAILQTLMDDGSRSHRQIAKITGVSSPTVETRIRRMYETGLITKIIPRFNPDKIADGLTALITFQVDDNVLLEIATKLSQLEEVRSVFLITSESNLMVRVVLSDAKDLQDFISYRSKEFGEIKMVSSIIVTRTIKDEQGIIIKNNLGIALSCDYCKADVAGKPVMLRVGQGERYFCCKICREAYNKKYKSRIEALSNQV